MPDKLDCSADAKVPRAKSIASASDSAYSNLRLGRVMEPDSLKLIESIHATEGMASLVIAGAGSQAINDILSVAGASGTVLDIQVPYASSAVVDYLGEEPSQYVSSGAALSLARAAYQRAVDLRETDVPVLGVACTATIATNRPKRGDHRCHVCVYGPTGWESVSITFVKGLRSREQEDRVVSRLILNSLASSLGLTDQLELELSQDDIVVPESTQFNDPLEALTRGHVGHVLVDPEGVQKADVPFRGGIISGSFNPRHGGHDQLAAAAADQLGLPVVFELSVTNVDKPELAPSEVRSRIDQFRSRASVIATRAPVFYEKARLLPGCVFVIGFDTLVRLVDPKYYDGSRTKMTSALTEMKSQGCSFLVAGRVQDDGFGTLRDIDVPADLSDMFTEIPESVFREDISSTEIRMAAQRSDS